MLSLFGLLSLLCWDDYLTNELMVLFVICRLTMLLVR